MRNIFVHEINQLMREREDVVFLTAECGFNVVEPIEQEFPERFYNTGIAEQSLVGTAAGMCLRGLKPVAYTMAMFLTMRAYEQIRVDVAYQNLPVLLAGVVPGLGYGNSGPTHHVIEDAAIMRVLPNMTVIYPSCETDVRAAVRQGLSIKGPCYIGLGRAPKDYQAPYTETAFQIGKALRIREGRDVALISYGPALPNALAAAELLEKDAIHAQVINMHTIKPLDTVTIQQAATDCELIMTVEEENIIGGLGGAVAEYLAEHHGQKCRFKRIGVPDTYGEVFGSHGYLQKLFGIDTDGIARQVKECLK